MSQPREAEPVAAPPPADGPVAASENGSSRASADRMVHTGHRDGSADIAPVEARLAAPAADETAELREGAVSGLTNASDLENMQRSVSQQPASATGEAPAEQADLLDLLADEEEAAAPQQPLRARSASPEDVDIADLFGEFYHPPEEDIPADPVVFDSARAVADLFGLSEAFFDPTRIGHADVEKLKEASRLDASFDQVRTMFGEETLDIIRPEGLREPVQGLLHATVPKSMPAMTTDSYLLSMPKVGNNVQTLHMEPRNYERSKEGPRVSTKREHYTENNIVRWAVNNGKAYTNTRLVLWSDGSRTIHVGPDIFEARMNTEVSLNLVTQGIQLEGKGGVTVPAQAGTVDFNEHWSLRTPARITNSVNETMARDANIVRDVQTRVPMIAGTVAAIGVAKDKKPPKGAKAPLEEEYLENQRKMRFGNTKNPKAMKIPNFVDQLEEEFKAYEKLDQLVEEDRLEQEYAKILEEEKAAAEEKARQTLLRRQAAQNTTRSRRIGGDDADDGGRDLGDDFSGDEDDMYETGLAEGKRGRDEDDDDDMPIGDLLPTKAKRDDETKPADHYIATLRTSAEDAALKGAMEASETLEATIKILEDNRDLWDEEQVRAELTKVAADVNDAQLFSFE